MQKARCRPPRSCAMQPRCCPSSRAGVQSRYLQTMADMSSNGKSSAIVFPLPLDLIRPRGRAAAQAGRLAAGRDKKARRPFASRLQCAACNESGWYEHRCGFPMRRDTSRYFYDSFTRQSGHDSVPEATSRSGRADLLKGVDEPMPISEVEEVIGPLCRLLDIQIEANDLRPFVIAVAGSVAVGRAPSPECSAPCWLSQAGRSNWARQMASCGRPRFLKRGI